MSAIGEQPEEDALVTSIDPLHVSEHHLEPRYRNRDPDQCICTSLQILSQSYALLSIDWDG